MWEEREWCEEEVELNDNIIVKNVTVYFSVYYDYDFGIKHCEDTRVDEIEYENIVYYNEDGEEVDLSDEQRKVWTDNKINDSIENYFYSH